MVHSNTKPFKNRTLKRSVFDWSEFEPPLYSVTFYTFKRHKMANLNYRREWAPPDFDRQGCAKSWKGRARRSPLARWWPVLAGKSGWMTSALSPSSPGCTCGCWGSGTKPDIREYYTVTNIDKHSSLHWLDFRLNFPFSYNGVFGSIYCFLFVMSFMLTLQSSIF